MYMVTRIISPAHGLWTCWPCWPIVRDNRCRVQTSILHKFKICATPIPCRKIVHVVKDCVAHWCCLIQMWHELRVGYYFHLAPNLLAVRSRTCRAWCSVWQTLPSVFPINVTTSLTVRREKGDKVVRFLKGQDGQYSATFRGWVVKRRKFQVLQFPSLG